MKLSKLRTWLYQNLCIPALVLLLFLFPPPELGGELPQEGPLLRTFQWKYNDEFYELEYPLSGEIFKHYATQPRDGSYIEYTHETDGYRFIGQFARMLRNDAQSFGLNDWETVNFIVSFVQGLDYIPETTTPEYPKFPIETLADQGGDCEDTAILLAAILDELDFETILISPPGHMAVGIAGKELDGSYYELGHQNYYYIETTGENWKIGQIPPDYTGIADLYTLDRSFSPKNLLADDDQPAVNDQDEEELSFLFCQSRQGQANAYKDRLAYNYSIQVSGNVKNLEKITAVKYRRLHESFPEYQTDSWITQTSPGNHFLSQWKGWGYAPILIRVEYADGSASDHLISEPPVEK